MVRVPVGDFLRLYEQTDPPEVMTVERFLLAHGREYEPQRRPKGIGRRKFTTLVYAYPLAKQRGLVYAEGFGIKAKTPRRLDHHSWCVDESGREIDPCWEEPEACRYFGIPFRLEFVERVTREHVQFDGVLMPDGFFDPRSFEGVDFLQELSPAGDEPP